MANDIPKLVITPEAATAIRRVMQSKQVPAAYRLRVGIKSQGMACAGMSFILGFDSKKEEDLELEVDGIPILVDRRHSMYIFGMEIDWHEDENQQGFVFNNPSLRNS